MVQTTYNTSKPTYTYPIFYTFWNNAALRGTLFPGRVYPDDSQSAKSDFKDLVDNTSSLIYTFINIK
jgi:hypothetical protein